MWGGVGRGAEGGLFWAHEPFFDLGQLRRRLRQRDRIPASRATGTVPCEHSGPPHQPHHNATKWRGASARPPLNECQRDNVQQGCRVQQGAEVAHRTAIASNAARSGAPSGCMNLDWARVTPSARSSWLTPSTSDIGGKRMDLFLVLMRDHFELRFGRWILRFTDGPRGEPSPLTWPVCRRIAPPVPV